MPKYLLTGVDGRMSSTAATYALSLATPTDHLILTSPRPGLIPQPLLTSWTSRGAQILMVDYDDRRNLERAFADVDTVAFVSSPNFLAGQRRRAQHRNVVEAARAAGVRRLVYTSLVGAGDDEDDGEGEGMPALVRDHAYTEDLVRSSGLEWNIQRNYLFADSIAEVLPLGGGSLESKAAFVAREDCGRVLGALLMGRGERNRVYTVTGPRAVSSEEVAECVARQSVMLSSQGEEDEQDLEARFRKRGMSDSWGWPTGLLGLEDVLGLRRLVSSGRLAGETDAVKKLTGRTPLDFPMSLKGGERMVADAGQHILC